MMSIQTPKLKNEINYTTMVALLGLATAIWTASGRYSALETQVRILDSQAQAWRDTHLVYHRERAQEVAAGNARIDERLKVLEDRSREMDRIEYRLSVQEQGATSLSSAVTELRQTLNDQSSDIRLIRQILEAQDEADNPDNPTSRRLK